MAAIIKMIVVLSLICGLSGFTLSYLRQTTAPIIEVQVLTYVQSPAIKAVFGDIENDPIAERKTFDLPDGQSVVVFPAKKNGKLQGIALEQFAPGYGGQVGVIVGIDVTTEKLMGVGVTTMRETPGLGTLISAPRFSDQFKGKDLGVKLSAQGGNIDAVSGATISSNAVIESVRKAVAIYSALKGELTGWDK